MQNFYSHQLFENTVLKRIPTHPMPQSTPKIFRKMVSFQMREENRHYSQIQGGKKTGKDNIT